MNGAVLLTHQEYPRMALANVTTPPTGYVALFVDDADSHLKQKDSAGVVIDLTTTGSGSGGVTDGDKGDIVVSGGGTIWNIQTDVTSIFGASSTLDQYSANIEQAIINSSVFPGGDNTQIQFNDGSGVFGGDAGLTYNKTTDTLSTVGLKIGTTSVVDQVWTATNTAGDGAWKDPAGTLSAMAFASRMPDVWQSQT